MGVVLKDYVYNIQEVELLSIMLDDRGKEISKTRLDPVGAALYSAKHNQVKAWYYIPPSQSEGNYKLRLFLKPRNNERIELAVYVISVNKEFPLVTSEGVPVQRRQLSVIDLIAKYPELCVVEIIERVIGYIIFDMKQKNCELTVP